MITLRRLGIEFLLDKKSTKGAEEATISLTELASKLGYQDKAQLKRLASRHSSELRAFGGTVTVTVSIRAGNAPERLMEEMAFNYHQAYYLIMRSETPKAKNLAVVFTSAFFALVRDYWQHRRGAPTPPSKKADPQLPKEEWPRRKEAEPAAIPLIERVRALEVEVARLGKCVRDARPDEPANYEAEESLWTVWEYMQTNKLTAAMCWPSCVGRLASRYYREKYNAEPQNKEVDVDGYLRCANVYPASILKAAVTEQCARVAKKWAAETRKKAGNSGISK